MNPKERELFKTLLRIAQDARPLLAGRLRQPWWLDGDDRALQEAAEVVEGDGRGRL